MTDKYTIRLAVNGYVIEDKGDLFVADNSNLKKIIGKKIEEAILNHIVSGNIEDDFTMTIEYKQIENEPESGK